MNEMKVLLCCGAGMSSGFLAQKTRQAAKKRKIAATVDARAESEVGAYLKSIDILFVGPHYASRLENFEQMAAPYNIPVVVIPQDIYAGLNGEALLDLAIQTIE
ncbi:MULTISPECIES: PTS sugar transporter subunit IIB [Breznakia]|uniref:PTS system cellobiose-specific IIB component n=1 Tax=Breznakia blatticola TaxID=1754012 RepID=A0A4R8ACS1_9FIRM|nr:MULTISPECIES: PTS sugar transporter subunit IIB [Breznakia]MDH6366094.1 PTS system cellobiose-specific IIB component [Breznakia sp. PH1-1]MDH6402974.1 PTS system cellobiose-specific IIB component [Breznakia sp. PF1-11]MDH6410683.1 PTS system cellobiose-specific IIB component [Breznakia sp. PFB1-11]MDH6413260.1 PTS system cellobiose-specific IIB component [Breznakia sp. PFB1-14]MDH6415628.1 PTS system cellobiose-specific IIB component [Breznakia sp. PFB1-4]